MSVIIVFGKIRLLILRIIFLYSLIGVQKKIRSELITPSFKVLTIVPGNLNLLILTRFDFDFS